MMITVPAVPSCLKIMSFESFGVNHVSIMCQSVISASIMCNPAMKAGKHRLTQKLSSADNHNYKQTRRTVSQVLADDSVDVRRISQPTDSLSFSHSDNSRKREIH